MVARCHGWREVTTNFEGVDVPLLVLLLGKVPPTIVITFFLLPAELKVN